MKKFWKITAMLFAALIVPVCLAACDDGDDDPEIVSEWISYPTIDGVTAEVNVTFYDDGTVSMTAKNGGESETIYGTYTGTGYIGQGVMTFKEDGEIVNISYTISSDGKTITFSS